MKLTAIFARKPGLITANLLGETVMMDMAGDRYYSLGVVGGRIWALLESPRSLEQLIEELMKVYDVDGEQCRRDVEPFLNDMLSRGLLTVGEE